MCLEGIVSEIKRFLKNELYAHHLYACASRNYRRVVARAYGRFTWEIYMRYDNNKLDNCNEIKKQFDRGCIYCDHTQSIAEVKRMEK